MFEQDPLLRYGLRVAITPWLVFASGMIIDWPLAFVGAVFTALFSLGQKPVPNRYGIGLIVAAYGYMIGACVLAVLLRPYPVALLLMVFVAVVMSYYLLLKSQDILLVVMALLGALLIPLQARDSVDTAWQLALWLSNNLLIAFVVSWFMFKVLPPNLEAKASPKPEANYDSSRRLLRLSIAILPFVAFAFITDNIGGFVITYLAVQLTQIAASPSTSAQAIKGNLLGNVAGASLAVMTYEIAVIAPFLPLIILVMLACYALMASKLLQGQALAITAMTAFTVVCGASFGPMLDEAGGKTLWRLVQIGSSLGYVYVALLLLDRYLPEKLLTENS